MSFPIAYLSPQIAIIVKPPGIPFHQTPVQSGFVQEFRKGLAPDSPLAQGRIYPVHRLDAVTSGLVVFARSKEVAKALSQAFTLGQVEKRYVALADRKPTKKQGMIVGDMEKSRRGAWRLSRTRDNPARTKMCSVSMAARRPGLRLYLLAPITGRTHQLRVALKSLGAPILGDGLYANAEAAATEERTYLHACALSFQIGDEVIKVIHQPDEGAEFCTPEFQQAWDSLGDLFGTLA